MLTVFLLISTISSMDQGILPTAITTIKNDYHWTDKDFGLFASLFYLGKLIGSVLFIFIMNDFNRKYFLMFALIVIALCSYVLISTTQLGVLCLCRFIFGLLQVYFLTFMLLWSEQFSFHQTKMAMIAMIQLSVPFGVVIGSLVTTLIGWRNTIYVQIIGSCLITVLLLFFNEKYFSVSFFSTIDPKSNSILTQMTVRSIFKKKSNSLVTKSNESTEENSNLVQAALIHTFKKISILFALIVRALLVLPLTMLSVWLIDYEANVLLFDSKERLISFCMVCTLSPTIGTIIGGGCGSLLGNYERRCSLLLASGLIGAAFGCGLFIESAHSIQLFTLILSSCICFSTSIIPLLTEFIISSTPSSLRNSINSITILISIGLGNVPGPYLYSLINSYGVNRDNSQAMKSLIYILILPLVLLFLTMIIWCCEKDSSNQPQGSYISKNMQPSYIKVKKKSTLFTTSIAAIYGNHLTLEEENQDEDNERDFNSLNTASKVLTIINQNLNSILSSSGYRSGSGSSSNSNHQQ